MILAGVIMACLAFVLIYWTAFRFSTNITIPSPHTNSVTPTLTHQSLLRKSTLQERSEPNQRLVQVFGIDNAFTTTNTNYYKTFVHGARSKMKTSEEDWKILADATSHNLEHHLSKSKETSTPIMLVDFIQVVVFRAVMLKFFPNTQMPSDADVQIITSSINSLWCTSKDFSYLLRSSLPNEKAKLLSILSKVFQLPIENIEGKENPLNILLPAYETLWRIVLRLFLELRFRSTDVESTAYTAISETFLLKPTPEIFHAPRSFPPTDSQVEIVDQLSLKAIINEGLRLYPPTRRIYRQVQSQTQTHPEKTAVDVEAIHRNPLFWGPNSLKFLPTRFMPGNLSKSPYFLPFGSGVFECPAKPSFAPMMIGLLVSGLMVATKEGWSLSGNEREEVASGGLLDGGRKAFGEVGLEVGGGVWEE